MSNDETCYASGMAHSKRHERYWGKFLLPGERAIHTFGVSGAYIVLFWVVPFLAMLLAAVVMMFVNVLLGALFIIPSLSLLLPAFYSQFFVHYAITDRRVMEREGVLHKRFVTVDLASITDVLIHEPFLERFITRTGTISVNTAGSPGSELTYRHVRRPFDVKQDIYRHLQEAQGKAAGAISPPHPAS